MARDQWTNSLVSVQFRENLKGLDLLEKSMPKVARRTAVMMAEAAKELIRDNWSPRAPSDPGSPPAMVSKTLDKSLYVTAAQARNAMGRFTKKFEVALIASTRYSGFLEEGTENMAPRPFMGPAVVDVSYEMDEYARVAFYNEFERWIGW